MMWLGGLLGRRRRIGEGLFEKVAAKPQPLAVNAVSDPLADMPFDGMSRLAERFAGHEHRIDGNQLIPVAMH